MRHGTTTRIGQRLARFGRRRPVLAVGTALALIAGGLVVAVVTPAIADDCSPNPVVCENAKPGNPASEWDISGAGDDSIQGFATDISVNVGDTIDFKIKTDASAYTIDIYRLGYYGGDGARKVAGVTPSASLPQTQPACVQDTTTWNYDCGTWAVSASWDVPSTAVSGVYIAKLTRTDTGGASQITFVVRDDASTSALYFKTSDATWEAYNPYGGEDFYTGANNGRSYEVSYNRPFATRGENDGRSFLFSNEYPMIRFLERNGYDVSYTTDVDADRHGNLLKNHKTFLSVGHDEYWSYPERANVEAARDAGVNLAFFSGNEAYWRTYYAPSKDGSDTAYRTVVCYKETWSNGHINDTSNQWTGTYRDPRYLGDAVGGGDPENSLTGTLYMSNDDDLALQVPAAQGRDRIWRGTSVASLADGDTATLAPHTIGYESDEDLDNGFRPAGLIDMSTTVGSTPEELADFGENSNPGTTTHHITLYKADSGALVFSAGTIQWAWGLDARHDGTAVTPSGPMQQATVNLLADLDAQPATLMSGLTEAAKSTDTTGPTVAVAGPATAANGAAVTIHGTATDSGGGVVAGVEASTDGGTTWHPASGTTSWTYTFYATGTTSETVKVRGIDDSANQGGATTVTIALTGNASLLGDRAPAPDSTTSNGGPVELGVQFTPVNDGYVTGIRFYKDAANTGTHTGSLWDAAGHELATGTFTGESDSGWQTLTFSAPVAVLRNTTYTASYLSPTGDFVDTPWAFVYGPWKSGPLTAPQGTESDGNGVFDSGGPGFPQESFQQSNYWVDVLFDPSTTVTRPTVLSTAPDPDATGVATTDTPQATFSMAMDPDSLSFDLTEGDTPVDGGTGYDAGSRTATFTPDAPLTPGHTYTATVDGTDSDGVPMAAADSWSFTVGAAITGPTVTIFPDGATPVTQDWSDPNPNELGVKFSSDVDGVVTGVRFWKGTTNGGTHTGSLWSATGTLLAHATFVSESDSGWQTVLFATPVAITAGASYVASYHTSQGNYAIDLGTLAGGLDSGHLHVPANGGVYSYGVASTFPGNAIPHNLWVDVLFTPQATAPAVTSVTPAANASGVTPAVHPSATFDKAVDPSSITFTVKQGGTTVPGTVAYDSATRTAIFTPSDALTASTVYSASVTASDTDGDAMAAPYTWDFTTTSAAYGPAMSVWPDSTTPANVNWSDPNPNSLGLKFTSDVDGVVSGVRFYKGPLNTGVHTGSLWTADGTLLATATFTNETASGWQSVSFSQPVAITAGTQYVVSYTTTTGYYAVDVDGLESTVDSGPLHALADGGMYNYGGGFPSNATNLNLWVDVIFQQVG